MPGIVSYGAYIPRRRLQRVAAFSTIGWYSPAIMMMAQGERSICNWDEDALTMAVAAARDCLIGQDKSKVEGVYLASTTMPFADRQNAGIQGSALNLPEQTVSADFASSQKAGTGALLAALDAVAGGGKKSMLVTASDHRQAKVGSFYELWFGDGAASLLVGDGEPIAEFLGSFSVSYDFVGHYRGAQKKFDYNWEERWIRDEGYAKIIPEAIGGLMSKLNLSVGDIAKFAYPCFFSSEHRRIGKKLGAEKEQIVRNMHKNLGETGTAHPLVMFVSALEAAQPGDKIIVAGFGQGCDALCFEVTDKIKELAPRQGVAANLADRVAEDNYPKYMSFNGMMVGETGIRAEAPTQTAMTVLWRKRKMILGLVGGKCTKCGTPQYPKMDMCVNPECNELHCLEDHEFADQPAFIKAFTGDLLAVCPEPPAVYGMVQFDNGGRMMADFTDCELHKLKVHMPVKMSFRKKYYDPDRGFTGYFWKAIPLKEQAEKGGA